MAPLTWDNSCRLCSEEKIEMVPIFGEEGLRRRVAQKLRICLPVMVYKADPLPKQICQFCAARLDDVYEFREYCVNVYRSMHLKLLTNKNLNSVKIFLDAMLNSPDPCQVQLCTIKQRAPPPLVPLPTSLPLSNLILPANATEIESPTLDSLPELPCEVQIKEEPADADRKTVSEPEAKESEANVGAGKTDVFDELPHDEIHKSNDETTIEKRTSILERVLTGNLTINDCKDMASKPKPTSQWWCSPCNNYYKTKEGLVKHMQLYCPRKYSCGKCSLIFESVADLAKHEGTDHLKINLDFDESVKECSECDREFVSWEMLKHHRLRDHIEEPLELEANTWCPLCNRFFPNIELYDNHKQLHEVGALNHDKYPEQNDNTVSIKENFDELKREHFIESIKHLTCPTCGKVCSQQSALSNHMRTHEPKKHKCNICGRSFGLFIRLAAHKLSEHNEQSIMSPIMATVEQEEALNAEREAREARVARLRCDSRRTYSEAMDDEEINNDQRPSKRASSLNSSASKNVARCGICQLWFSNHTTMLIHLQTHSDNLVANNFTCSVCKRNFKEKWRLQRHETLHKLETVSANDCSVCQKSFSDKTQLEAHEKIHVVDRTYHCPKCNKIFFKELSLIAHQCPGSSLFSKKIVSTKGNQSNELSTGMDDKKFKCTKCPATFFSSQLRNLHMRKHVEQNASDLNDDDNTDIMPNLMAEMSPETSILLLEPRVEIKEDLGPPVPLKRTLIKTAGGYRCGVCQSPFVLRDLAVAHLRSAHPVMPYQCPYCKKRFITQYTFSHHIKTDHPNE